MDQDQVLEVINPPNPLKNKLKPAPRGRKFDAVKEAEKALHALSENFSFWIAEEADNLFDVWHAALQHDFDAKSCELLFRKAHDIRGHAQTMGYDNVGIIASYFCDVMEAADPKNMPAKYLLSCIQAIRTIVKERLKDGNKTLTEIMAGLEKIKNRHLAAAPE